MNNLRQDQHFMQLALDACKEGISKKQSPFGACIVDPQGQVIACDHNHVWHHLDITAHAEVITIRKACTQTQKIHLAGATIYSTTEPCPMCFSAIHWARIKRIVYAASIEDAKQFGFNELNISNQKLKQFGSLSIEITAGFMREQAVGLFEQWQQQQGQSY